MLQIATTTNLRRCEQLWRAAIPGETIWDRWDFRECFHRAFERPPVFITVRDGTHVVGLLPLSWIEETGNYAMFPGETWHGRTWLEQNRVVARDPQVFEMLMSACPAHVDLRYLRPDHGNFGGFGEIDEIGYLFSPPRYGFDIGRWFAEFSGKHAKRLRREIETIEARDDLVYRLDALEDVETFIELNLASFGSESYFHGRPFRRGFEDAIDLLASNGWLRITTILAGTEPAAIDIGCLYRGTYTLLAGGVNPDFRGIAKVINLRHLRRACDERMESVDFLCGDFGWKDRFHLEPRPLYSHARQRAAVGAGVSQSCGINAS